MRVSGLGLGVPNLGFRTLNPKPGFRVSNLGPGLQVHHSEFFGFEAGGLSALELRIYCVAVKGLKVSHHNMGIQ